MSKFLIFACSLLMISSCTYSIAMNHSSGSASDVIDEAATLTPTASVTIPASVI